MTALLTARGVETFYGSIQALKGIDIDVAQGEIVTLIGANGAGKSTLMMTICGLPQARRVSIVYDGVGAATFEASLASLARRGMLVCIGNASGPVPPFAPLRLAGLGSLYITRPTLGDYVATTEELDASAAAFFDRVQTGDVKIEIGGRWPLAQAAEAHQALEGRRTTGGIVLVP